MVLDFLEKGDRGVWSGFFCGWVNGLDVFELWCGWYFGFRIWF